MPHQLTPGKNSTLVRLFAAAFSGSWPVFSVCSSSPSSPDWSTSTAPCKFHLCYTFFQREGESLGLRWLGVSPEEMVEDRTEDRSLACNGGFSLGPGWGDRIPSEWSLPLVGFTYQVFLHWPWQPLLPTSLEAPWNLRVGRTRPLAVVPVCHALSGC